MEQAFIISAKKLFEPIMPLASLTQNITRVIIFGIGILIILTPTLLLDS